MSFCVTQKGEFNGKELWLGCHLNKKEEGRKRGGREGAGLRGMECSHLPDAEETLVEVGTKAQTREVTKLLTCSRPLQKKPRAGRL